MLKVAFLSLLALVPTSSNYVLRSYDFGNGGGSGTSATYQLQTSVGSNSGSLSGSSYKLPTGVLASTTVATPAAPNFTNPDDSYDRLKISLPAASAPSDIKYAIAISADNFTTTKYVQSDQTVGTNFNLSNYQTYAAWGGAGGCWILGLSNSTTYQVKVAALQGKASGSGFGPIASASTSAPSVTFGLSTSLTSTPPFSSNFNSLPVGTVTASDANIITNITTNAKGGGQLLIFSKNGGLHSATTGYTLASATADLDSASSGYGGQISGTSQTSGGPLIALTPYNNNGNNVGVLASSWQQIASFGSPIVSGSATLALKAKTDSLAPPASDYSDTLTLSISLLF
ncbi:MAG TPA: hypothetical protein VMR45_02960 [Patescibacteria group bacterium]|nr:hypothetical protein [Patescibacteria group bacterium]